MARLEAFFYFWVIDLEHEGALVGLWVPLLCHPAIQSVSVAARDGVCRMVCTPVAWPSYLDCLPELDLWLDRLHRISA